MPKPTLKDEIRYAVSNAIYSAADEYANDVLLDTYAMQIEQAIVRRLIELRQAQDADAVQDAHHEGVCQGIELAISAMKGESA